MRCPLARKNYTNSCVATLYCPGYGSFSSGGLSVGNAVLEVVRPAEADGSGSAQTSFQGIAFEPVGTAESTLAWLDKRSLGHSAPNPFKVMIDGSERVRAIRFGLDLPPSDASIFVCDYKSRDSVREGREIASRELLRSGGGPLGIRALRGIVIALADLKQGTDSWASFFGRERLGSTGGFLRSRRGLRFDWYNQRKKVYTKSSWR